MVCLNRMADMATPLAGKRQDATRFGVFGLRYQVFGWDVISPYRSRYVFLRGRGMVSRECLRRLFVMPNARDREQCSRGNTQYSP